MKYFYSAFVLALLSICPLTGQTLPCDASTGFRRDPKRASVYIEFEQRGAYDAKISTDRKSATIQRGNDIWVRLRNNTCWSINFLGFSIIDDINGKVIWGVKDDGIGNVDYIPLEANGAYVPVEGRGDARIEMYLESGASFLFPIKKPHLENRSIYVEFHYEWERIPSAGLEHRITYRR